MSILNIHNWTQKGWNFANSSDLTCPSPRIMVRWQGNIPKWHYFILFSSYFMLFQVSEWLEFTRIQPEKMSEFWLRHRGFGQAEFRPALTEKTRPGQVCLEKKAPHGRDVGGERIPFLVTKSPKKNCKSPESMGVKLGKTPFIWILDGIWRV